MTIAYGVAASIIEIAQRLIFNELENRVQERRDSAHKGLLGKARKTRRVVVGDGFNVTELSESRGLKTLRVIAAAFVVIAPTGFVILHVASGAAAKSIIPTALIIFGGSLWLLGRASTFSQSRSLESAEPAAPTRISTAVASVLSSDEFKPYVQYRDVGLEYVKERESEITADMLREDALLAEAQQKSHYNSAYYSQARKQLFVGVAPVLSVAAVALVAAINSVVGRTLAEAVGFFLTDFQRFAIVLATTAVLAGGVIAIIRIDSNGRRAAAAHRIAVRQAAISRNDKLRSVVSESLSRVINERSRRDGFIALTASAPRLVELSTSEIKPSRSMQYLREFVEGHESSAIGLAGSRGAGKSTIMRSFVGEWSTRTGRSIYVPAPVAYDATEFSRYLLMMVAREFQGSAEGDMRRRHDRRRVIRSRRNIFGLMFGIGLALVLIDRLPLEIPSLSPLAVLGGTFIGYAVIGFYYQVTLRVVSGDRARRTLSAVQKEAIGCLEELRWETEEGVSSKNTFKVWVFGDLADEDSFKKKQRALTKIDYIQRLKRLLAEAVTDSQVTRLVICIDELDKLPSADALVDVVNTLKELFHEKGVHFVVSVSLDALRSFEQRGLPNRDAFDSAFDTVIDVGRLSVNESIDVISSRATRFPIVLARYCHAWAGGLPRDLLRVARRCVELQRDRDDPTPAASLVATIIEGDLARLFDGLLGASKTDDAALWAMREALGKESPHWTSSVESILAASQFNSSTVAAASRLIVGAYLIELAKNQGYWDERSDTPADPVWFELLAEVVSSTSKNYRLQDLAIQACQQRIPVDIGVGIRQIVKLVVDGDNACSSSTSDIELRSSGA